MFLLPHRTMSESKVRTFIALQVQGMKLQLSLVYIQSYPWFFQYVFFLKEKST